jgi:WD40 repeat protein
VFRLHWRLVLVAAAALGVVGASSVLRGTTSPMTQRPRGVLVLGPCRCWATHYTNALRTLNGHTVFSASAREAVSVAPDSRSVAEAPLVGEVSQVRLRDLQTHRDRVLSAIVPAASRGTNALDWSPDGLALAIEAPVDCLQVARNARRWVDVVFLGRRAPRVLYAPAFSAKSPVPTSIVTTALGWSRDGGRILIAATLRDDENGTCDQGFGSRLWSFNVTTGASKLLARSRTEIDYAAFSSDGRSVFYLDGSWGGGRLWVANADGTNRHSPGAFQVDTAAFSPDGRQIAFIARYDNMLHVLVEHVDGTHHRQLAVAPNGSPTALAWAPSQDIVAMLHGRLVVTGLDATTRRSLQALPLGRCASFWLSATGRSLAIDSARGKQWCTDPERPPSLHVVRLDSGATWNVETTLHAGSQDALNAVDLEAP